MRHGVDGGCSDGASPQSCLRPPEGIKDVAVQHLGAIRPIESFDIGVLRWFAWLDVIESNTHGPGPLSQRMCNEFRAVVQTN
jgi:hypothetical protein